MPEWILVNGARVERTFFEDNLLEAKTCNWRPCERHPDKSHKHCLICGVASSESSAAGWCSDVRWLCESCHGQFMEGATPEKSE